MSFFVQYDSCLFVIYEFANQKETDRSIIENIFAGDWQFVIDESLSSTEANVQVSLYTISSFNLDLTR